MSGAVPQLRFPGFSGEWTIADFGDLTTIASGQVDPTVEPYASMPHIAPDNIEGGTGNIRNVRTAREDGVFSGKYAFDERAIVYSKIRPNLNKVGKPGIVGICSADMYPIWGVEGRLNTDYLLQVMRGEGFVSAATSVSMRTGLPKINRPDLNAIRVPLPEDLTEQQKIADFLGTVDAKLEALRRKKSGLEAFKSGLMQRLFSQALRFRRDDGTDFPDWEWFDAGEVFGNVSNKDHDGTLPILSITQNAGAVLREDNGIDIKATAESVLSYKVVEPGDFIISLRSFQGGIEYSTVLGICSPAYTIMKPTRPIADGFFKQFMKSKDFVTRLSLTVVGIRDGKQISFGAFSELTLPYPHPDEQRKIAEALSALDAKIAAVADQITNMETFKKGLLQQLFV